MCLFTADSCDGRCIESLRGSLKPQLGCACYVACITEENCCPDFYETCINNYTDPTGDDSDQSNTTIELPQTQKLVAKYTSPLTTTTTSETPITTKITTIIKPGTSTTSTTTKQTFEPSVTSTRAVKTTTNAIKVTVTVFQKDEINDTSKYERTAASFKETTGTTSVVATKKITETTTRNKKTTVALKPTTRVVVQKFTTVVPKSTKALQSTGKINKNKSIDVNEKLTEKHGKYLIDSNK
ncbi:unnamed protein product [Diatraea saccharalis]|uniref:SMB domain-containing protein n=1 Tax=Diatraea saccharalis TaxID=40085 RepID=A0A9N9RGU1_9NEOP|nr:unnamed protein product [Diatraea saccharalis]